MLEEGTRWVHVMLFYLFLIVIVPMTIYPNKSVFSVKSMRIQMVSFILSGLMFYFLGAWYIKNGDYKKYTLKANNKLLGFF